MSEWQPTEEEYGLALDAYLGSGEDLREALAAVGPAIAARALREAANDFDYRAIGGPTKVRQWLRARADRIETP
jgi:hypothetical protein